LVFKSIAGLLPSGAQTSVAVKLIAAHDPVDLITGVLPLIAHVFLTVGRSEIPDSSWNPSLK
jgi:hypothetical protein